MRNPSIKEFLERVDTEGDHWIWLGPAHANGRPGGQPYGRWKDGRRAHRVSYEIFIGPLDSEDKVLHTCDIGLCVNPEHLLKGTQADNIRDASSKGRMRGSVPGRIITQEHRDKISKALQGNRNASR